MKKILGVALLVGMMLGMMGVVKADGCEGKTGEPLYTCLGEEISRLSRDLQLSRDATSPLETEASRLGTQISSIQYQINQAKVKQTELAAGISERDYLLSEQYLVSAEKTKAFYKRIRSSSTLAMLMTSVGTGSLSREFNYRNEANERDRQIIVRLSSEIGQLESDKQDLEIQREKLSGLQASLDKQKSFYDGEIGKAKAYQTDLSGKIAALSAKQQEVLGEKSGTFQTTVGDVPLADDPNSRPDYNPGFSPAFAAFSFGAPHFKGMSQYGAFGRAKDGQSYEDILRAYYGGGIEIRSVDVNTKITVDGYGSYSIDDYAKRIYEVPGSWGDEGGMAALEAQAIAARSYALARGGSICATEACQVFKPNPKGGNWETAVNNTSGKVVYANGSPLSTWYASTSGGYQESYTSNGYSTPGFWDTSNGRDGWTSEAYEKKAGSPWFYKGWYKTRSGDSCGRSHPWLTGEEMADVLNAWVVVVKRGESDDRVLPLGGCWGGNPYSVSEMKDKANSSGEGYSNVTGVVRVDYSNSGYTQTVVFGTDRGEVSINGLEFKKAFNLRAPGRIALKSGLLNIEQK